MLNDAVITNAWFPQGLTLDFSEFEKTSEAVERSSELKERQKRSSDVEMLYLRRASHSEFGSDHEHSASFGGSEASFSLGGM